MKHGRNFRKLQLPKHHALCTAARPMARVGDAMRVGREEARPGAPVGLATSREQAIPLCEAMRRQGLIQGVGIETSRPFMDGSTQFRFVPQPTLS